MNVKVDKHVLMAHLLDPFYHLESSLPVSLEEVLSFFTGADREPPLGFPVIPKLEFLHSDGILATASTCSLILRLPTVHDSYPRFRQYMALSFGGHGGFGVV